MHSKAQRGLGDKAPVFGLPSSIRLATSSFSFWYFAKLGKWLPQLPVLSMERGRNAELLPKPRGYGELRVMSLSAVGTLATEVGWSGLIPFVSKVTPLESFHLFNRRTGNLKIALEIPKSILLEAYTEGLYWTGLKNQPTKL